MMNKVPNGWKLTTLGQIAQITSGGTPDRETPEYWNGDIPWVTTGEVNFCEISDTKEKITKIGLDNSSAKVFPSETILMAMYGQGKTRGQVAKLIIPAATNQACAAILLKESFDADFYYQYLCQQYKNIRLLGNSGTQKNLNGSIIKEIIVHYPPLPEQIKIAEILSTWDNAINTVQKLLANSQQQKKALMQQVLTGKKRFAEFEGEWEEKRLGDLFSRVTTKNSEINTNVVTISAQQGLIKQEDFFSKSVASETLDGYFLIKKGQFAYNKSYSNGYPMGAIKRLNKYDKGVVTTLYICFELKNEERSCSDFFDQFFNAGFLNRGLSKVANEGGRAHGLLNVKSSDFFSLVIAIPSFPEQLKIAAILTTADQEIDNLRAQLNHLKQEKKALMQQLLTGKRRVKIEEAA